MCCHRKVDSNEQQQSESKRAVIQLYRQGENEFSVAEVIDGESEESSYNDENLMSSSNQSQQQQLTRVNETPGV